MLMTTPSLQWLCVPLMALSPCLAWSQAASEKATITLEVTDRSALEAALAELQSQGVISHSNEQRTGGHGSRRGRAYPQKTRCSTNRG